MENLEKVQLDFGFECEPISNQKKLSISEKRSETDFVLDLMDFMRSPIIVFKSTWQDAVPSDLLKNIPMSRLMSMMTNEKMASLTEVVAYMMPRTLEGPLPTEWVNIYTWSGFQHAKTFGNKEQLEAMKEIVPKTLSDYENGLLNSLRKWIYNQRRKALKAILKTEKSIKSKEIANEQVALFDK